MYYVITLGGVGGPDTNDDIDDALRRGLGVKGACTYYVITLGGVGGPDTNDDFDDALRGVGG